MQLSILGTGGAVYEKNADNNNSLVVTVTHCGNRFLFAGDIEKQRIADLLETGVASCDVLNVQRIGNSLWRDTCEFQRCAICGVSLRLRVFRLVVRFDDAKNGKAA